ncbi:MAG: adenylate/guanylate cyclase domain-containing protein [Cyanobacteria bacterium P01_A01_bin.17]
MLENPQGLRLGGQRRQITMLASDLRGFTALSERISPEDVVKVLNLYLKYMADVILQYRGTIDDYLGDGITVLFGAPESREDDATRAVACAIAMQLAMTEVNTKIMSWGFPALEMGIGINTGEVVLGNIGSERRTKYSAIGSQMNLVFRIESYTVGRQIYISESTLEAAGGSSVEVVGTQVVYPKGMQQPIMLYEVGGLGQGYNLLLQQNPECFLLLPQPISLRYTILDGKQVQGPIFTGHLTELSARGAKVRCDGRDIPSPLVNVKLNLDPAPDVGAAQEDPDTDIYAKVMRGKDESFQIVFTMIPPLIEVKLRTIYTLMMAIRI